MAIAAILNYRPVRGLWRIPLINAVEVKSLAALQAPVDLAAFRASGNAANDQRLLPERLPQCLRAVLNFELDGLVGAPGPTITGLQKTNDAAAMGARPDLATWTPVLTCGVTLNANGGYAPQVVERWASANYFWLFACLDLWMHE